MLHLSCLLLKSVYIYIIFQHTTALTCFDCQNISHPRFCEYVKKCPAGQVCGLEREVRVNGDVIYNLGCVTEKLCSTGQVNTQSIQPCINCCGSDLCNSRGCGETDFSGNTTTCYSCTGQSVGDACHTVSFCESFEMCYLEEKSHFGEKFYHSGCKLKHVCDYQSNNLPIIGRRDVIEKRSASRLSCCSGNICNDLDRIHGQTDTTTQLPATTTILSSLTSTIKNNVIPEECADIPADVDGVYSITPNGSRWEMPVYCIMRGPNKWTVIQKRFNGSIDFYRGWTDYRKGFGSISGEYWLGNDNIHLLTADGRHEISIYLEDFTGQHAYANYSMFMVDGEITNFRLSISGYHGTAGDGFKTGNGKAFTTKDNDHDECNCNCAVDRHSGWWFESCDYANLNGAYHDKGSDGNYWYTWLKYEPMKKSIMMIKRK